MVLGRDEMRALLGEMAGTTGLVAQILYGAGMRLMECKRLRVKDVSFIEVAATFLTMGKRLYSIAIWKGLFPEAQALFPG